jgi:hypothetical protein
MVLTQVYNYALVKSTSHGSRSSSSLFWRPVPATPILSRRRHRHSESTLGYIDLAPSNSDEEHYSQLPPHDAVGCIIDLTMSDSKGEHAPVKEERGDGGGGLGGP